MPRQSADGGSQSPRVTQADYDRWKTELSNWGRWGKDDEIGALNLITPKKRKEALGLAKEAFPVSLASDADTVKAVDNQEPYERNMLGIGTDKITVVQHGVAHTHLDSLAHVNEKGVFYNAYKPDPEAVKQDGHARNSVHNLKNGILTRGVLIDVPRLKGLPYLEPGTPIYVEDLEAWEKQAGVKISAGDAIFVRTGVWARRHEKGPWLRGRYKEGRQAGLDPSVIPWLKQRDVAVVGGDASYVWPSHMQGTVHDFALLYLGATILDNCDLEALSAAAAARKRWAFLFTVAPLPIPGGTGSPVNPIAIF